VVGKLRLDVITWRRNTGANTPRYVILPAQSSKLCLLLQQQTPPQWLLAINTLTAQQAVVDCHRPMRVTIVLIYRQDGSINPFC